MILLEDIKLVIGSNANVIVECLNNHSAYDIPIIHIDTYIKDNEVVCSFKYNNMIYFLYINDSLDIRSYLLIDNIITSKVSSIIKRLVNTHIILRDEY